MARSCHDCDRYLGRESFSKTQWAKGVSVSRCHACVSAGTARAHCSNVNLNLSNLLVVTDGTERYPWREGTLKNVNRGVYEGGPRDNEYGVYKWSKSGLTTLASTFNEDIDALKKTIQLIKEYNCRGYIDHDIKVNRATVWRDTRTDETCLVEPYIANFQKFNSNTGWTEDSTPWPRVMQALSHFSYHATHGQFTLCDLQGGFDKETGDLVITDPVILSHDGRYGATDLGREGIINFFAHHHCNEYCSKEWTRPRNRAPIYEPEEGSKVMSSGAHFEMAPFGNERRPNGFNSLAASRRMMVPRPYDWNR